VTGKMVKHLCRAPRALTVAGVRFYGTIKGKSFSG
jgi:hypothetical protein